MASQSVYETHHFNNAGCTLLSSGRSLLKSHLSGNPVPLISLNKAKRKLGANFAVEAISPETYPGCKATTVSHSLVKWIALRTILRHAIFGGSVPDASTYCVSQFNAALEAP